MKDFNPTALLIDWCFAKDGDVANALSGVFSRMLLEYDNSRIVGANKRWVKLSEHQKELLDIKKLLINY